MNYRLATVADLQALANLRWEFRAEAGEISREDHAAFTARYIAFVTAGIGDGTWTYWIAEHRGVVVAQMAVCRIRSIPRPARLRDEWGYLTDCYTQPEYRRQGIGEALLRCVCEWATTEDLELLVVWPSDDATAFYHRAGFRSEAGLLQLALRQPDDSA